MSVWEVSRLGGAPLVEDSADDYARGVLIDPGPYGADERSTSPQAKPQGGVTEESLIGDLARKIVASAGIPKNADPKALAEAVHEALNKLVTELATRPNAALSLGKDLSGTSLDGPAADARFRAEVAAAMRGGTLKLDLQAATLIAEARLSGLSSIDNPALAFQDCLAQRLGQLISLDPKQNVAEDAKQHLARPAATGPTFDEKLRVVQLVMNSAAVVENRAVDVARLAGLLLAAIGGATKRSGAASSSENVVLTSDESSALSDAVMTSKAVLAMPQNRQAQARNFPAALASVNERREELAKHPDHQPPAKDPVWLTQHMADVFVLGNPDAKTIPLPTSTRQLENYIGRALGLPPDNEPKTADEFDLDRRGEWSWYAGDNLKAIHQVTDSIQRFRKHWGAKADQATLTALPLIIDRKDSLDPRPSVLWRITLPSGRDYFVDVNGRIHDGLQAFFDHNSFPEGQISVPLDGHVKLDFTGYVELQTTVKTESGWHRGLQIGGLAVGAVLIVGSDFIGTPVVLWLGGILGIVGLADHGYDLYDRAAHYQAWAPGKETLPDYLGIIGSFAGIGAGATGLRALSAVSNETSNAARLMNMAKVAGGVQFGTGVATTGISAQYLYRNWNSLPPADKTTALIGMIESGAGLAVGARAWRMSPKITAGEDGLYTVQWRQGGQVTAVLRRTADGVELVKLDGAAVSPTTGGRLFIAAQRITGLPRPKFSIPAPPTNTGSAPSIATSGSDPAVTGTTPPNTSSGAEPATPAMPDSDKPSPATVPGGSGAGSLPLMEEPARVEAIARRARAPASEAAPRITNATVLDPDDPPPPDPGEGKTAGQKADDAKSNPSGPGTGGPVNKPPVGGEVPSPSEPWEPQIERLDDNTFDVIWGSGETFTWATLGIEQRDYPGDRVLIHVWRAPAELDPNLASLQLTRALQKLGSDHGVIIDKVATIDLVNVDDYTANQLDRGTRVESTPVGEIIQNALLRARGASGGTKPTLSAERDGQNRWHVVAELPLEGPEDSSGGPQIMALTDDQSGEDRKPTSGQGAGQPSGPATKAGGSGNQPPPRAQVPGAAGNAPDEPLRIHRMPADWSVNRDLEAEFKITPDASPTVQIVKLQRWGKSLQAASVESSGPQAIAEIAAVAAGLRERIPGRIEINQLDLRTQAELKAGPAPEQTPMGAALQEAASLLGVAGKLQVITAEGEPVGLAIQITPGEIDPAGLLAARGFPWFDDEAREIHWRGQTLEVPDLPLHGDADASVAHDSERDVYFAYWPRDRTWEGFELRFDKASGQARISNLHLSGSVYPDLQGKMLSIALTKAKMPEGPSVIKLPDIQDPVMLNDLRSGPLEQTKTYQLFKTTAEHLNQQLVDVNVVGPPGRPTIVVHLAPFSRRGGVFNRQTNAAGGQIITSIGKIDADDVEPYVRVGSTEGK